MTAKQHFKTLQLKAKHQVYTLLSGNNLSKLHGEGYDFSELREYVVGDDIRKISWNVTAKMGRPYVKELHANRELSVAVASMMSASLQFGLKGSVEERAKQDKLVEVATLIAYAAQHNSDLFTGIYYKGSQNYATAPTKQLYTIDKYCQSLYECDTLGTKLKVSEIASDLFARLHRPSLLFIIGDFLQPVDLSLLAQKHEIIAIIIRHPHETNPQKLGEIILQNPENERVKNIFFGKESIKNYQKKLEESDERIKAKFDKYGVRYTTITSDEEAVAKLMSLLS